MVRQKPLFFSNLILLPLLLILTFSCSDKKGLNSDKESIVLRLQWHIQTQFAGYYVALAKGFYSDEGLEVKIEQGGYGKNSISTVEAGIEEFGTKWMADLVASDGDFISLANILKDNGLLLISKKEKGIESIDDFINNKVSTWFIGNEFQLFSLLDKYKLSKDEVEVITQKWDMTQFYNDEVDIVSAMSYNEFLKVGEKGYTPNKLNTFSFKDLKLGFPGQNIFTSKTYYKKNRTICEKFIRASLKGWEYAINNPVEATDIVMIFDKEKILDRDHQLKQMEEIIKLIQIDKYTLGFHRAEDYQLIETIFKRYDIIEEDKDLEELYTNQLIEE